MRCDENEQATSQVNKMGGVVAYDGKCQAICYLNSFGRLQKVTARIRSFIISATNKSSQQKPILIIKCSLTVNYVWWLVFVLVRQSTSFGRCLLELLLMSSSQFIAFDLVAQISCRCFNCHPLFFRRLQNAIYFAWAMCSGGCTVAYHQHWRWKISE